MPLDPFQELLLSELKEMKNDIKDVRVKDIPDLKTEVAGFHGKLKTLEKQQRLSTKIYTLIGGAVAVIITKFTGHHS